MSHPKKILDELGVPPRKSLSQNFLISPHWAERLAAKATEPQPISEVWEIGGGLGALTVNLVARSPVPIRVFEYDKTLAPYLRKTIPGIDVVEGDFLTQDLSRYAASRVSVLGNLPYHISSPILFRLMENRQRFAQCVLTFQRELAERLIARPRTADYGAISILVQLRFRIEPLGIISRGSFYPEPEVDSEVLVMTPLADASMDDSLIERVVHAAFRHRRKTLVNNLSAEFVGRDLAISYLNQLGISPRARPEELSKDEFVGLTSLISTK